MLRDSGAVTEAHQEEALQRFESSGVAVQRRRRGLALAAVLPLLVIGLTAALRSPVPLVLSMYAAPPVAAMLAFEYFGPIRMGRAPPAMVEIGPAFLSVTPRRGRALRFPRQRILDGWLESHGDDHRAVLRIAGAELLAIRVPDQATGHRLLAAAGLAADQRRLRAPLVSAFSERWSHSERDGIFVVGGFAAFLALLATTLLATFTGPAALVLVLPVLAILGYKLLGQLLPRSAIVGTDGVTLRSLGGSEFVSYADVTDLRVDDRGVSLRLASGQSRLLATAPNPGRAILAPHPGPAERALYERIRDAMSAGHLGTDADARFAVLERRGRSLGQWQEDMLALGKAGGGAAGYRAIPLERDELTRVVHDASASAERRIGAAIALGADRGAYGDRLRIAADTCADDRLRVAIEKAADGDLDEEALEEAVREAESPEEPMAADAPESDPSRRGEA